MSDKKKKSIANIDTVDSSNSYEVASQYKLMWWKFKKHKAAMIAVPVLIIMYLICMCCEFFAPALPLERYKDYKDTAPTRIHLWDDEGNFVGPFVYGLERYTDPYTFRKSYVESDQIIKLGFFVRGSEYGVFGSNLKWDVHFFGVQLPEGEEPGGHNVFFLMGTDSLGRDVFSRILSGGRISLSFCLVSVAFTVVIGLTLGGLSGYLGGVVDTIGAGDAHAGAVMLGLSRGMTLADAAALANRVCAKVVETEGATLSDEDFAALGLRED